MKAKLYDYKKNETREIDTQFLSLLQWVRVNFGGWGFYEIKRAGTATKSRTNSQMNPSTKSIKGV